MLKLTEAFWKICLLQLRPQDLPASGFLVGFSVGLYVLINTIGAALTLGPMTAIVATAFHTALLLGLTYLILWARELTPRYNQTVSALAGSNVVLTFIALPMLIWQQQSQDPALAPAFIMLGLMIWNLAIVGHILRHALNVHFLIGTVLAVLYMYISVSIGQMLFITPTTS